MKNRILFPELMDDPGLDPESLKMALEDVTLVNTWLGGQQITLEGLDFFFEKYPKDNYTIIDLGCGDGAMLRSIADHCRKKKLPAKLIGMDLNPKSLALAASRSKDYEEISYRQQDILALDSDSFSCDIVVSVLTMHHFSNAEIERFIGQFMQLADLGIVINDLHRSRLAYYLFQAFSRIFMKTYIARHDGLVSIGRAFKKKELLTFADNLGIKKSTIRWRWAFRYLWILEKEK